MIKIMPIFGTRPEAIKMAPVILLAGKRPDIFDVDVCVTGQHRAMLDQMLSIFGIVPDDDFDLMQPDQSLADISSRTIKAASDLLKEKRPDWVLVQGDTTTVWAAAVAAFFQGIPVAHIEAGLRTGDKYQPFPEEINRRIATQIAELHFAPTQWAKNNLLKEGISEEKIIVTGNTVIDALYWIMEKNAKDPTADVVDIGKWYDSNIAGRKMVLITGHRRESFGEGFQNICEAIAKLASEHPDVCWVFPVHLNPNVQEPVNSILGKTENIHLIEPLGYGAFTWLMNKSAFILTDSGGVQEEASSLSKHVLVMRNKTERPEGVEAGIATLVGNSKEGIIDNCERLLNSEQIDVTQNNLYGDGKAAERILESLHNLS
jgi:UDP-N-acetylglucosamine 2-epimerase (non-hydrolysing)